MCARCGWKESKLVKGVPYANPRRKKSYSSLQLGTSEGELLVRPGGHVCGRHPSGMGDVLDRCQSLLYFRRTAILSCLACVEMRSSLIGMASTTLATAGIVFTLLTLPLSTVAAQYGSRLLRVFLGDRTTQFVLGIFAGTFMYCIAGCPFDCSRRTAA